MFYFVSEPVKVKIQVFHVTMVFRILGHSDCTLVVHFKGGMLFNTISKFREDVPHSCNLLPSLNSSHVLCFCGRESNNSLQFAVPSNCTTSYHGNISSSGTSSINTVTMGGIRVGEEEFIACQITFVGDLVISSALDIAEEVFECFPVFWTSIGVEACKVGNSMGNIRSGHNGKMLKLPSLVTVPIALRYDNPFLVSSTRTPAKDHIPRTP